MKQTLYIDTDAGVDDIIAICMVLQTRNYSVRGISLVNGVVSVKNGLRMIARILSYIGMDAIPLYGGINQVQQNSSVQFPAIDRSRATSFKLLPKIPIISKQPRVDNLKALQTCIAKETKPVTILCLGPLGNIALMIRNKSVRRAIKQLVIMGGAVNVPGIVPPRNIAEYNFRLDPLAAREVLESGIPITLIPIDATKQVPALVSTAPKSLKNILGRFQSQISNIRPVRPIGKIIQSIILNNSGDFQNFYDPLAAAVLLNQSIISSWRTYQLTVSTQKITLGKVLIQNNEGPVLVPNVVEVNKFYKLMLQSLQ
ncbi:nucleoside hydrolase [Candidatus Gottesmanbacteria bacterium]|nr:nucleoside hydrolase [Candidatus Gottesmanbacteria bacterium]